MDGGGVTVEGTTSLAVDDDEDKDKVDKLVGIVARAASHLVIPPHSIKAQCNKGRVTFYPTLPWSLPLGRLNSSFSARLTKLSWSMSITVTCRRNLSRPKLFFACTVDKSIWKLIVWLGLKRGKTGILQQTFSFYWSQRHAGSKGILSWWPASRASSCGQPVCIPCNPHSHSQSSNCVHQPVLG